MSGHVLGMCSNNRRVPGLKAKGAASRIRGREP